MLYCNLYYGADKGHLFLSSLLPPTLLIHHLTIPLFFHSLSRVLSFETSCWQSWSMLKTHATNPTNSPNWRWHTHSHNLTQNTPACLQSPFSLVHNHHHTWVSCVWIDSRGEHELRCLTTSTTSCTDRARQHWVWARLERRISWRMGDTGVS